MDRLVLVPDDRRLDRALEELVGVAAEELVERVLAGHVDGQAAPAPPGAPPHLAQGGDRAREGHADGGVERADVDAELERVGRDHRAQLARGQARLELAALLRRVAGAIWGDEVGQAGVVAGLELEPRQPRDELDRLARLDEADRPRALAHELGHELGGLGQRAAADLQRLVDDGRVPHRDLAPRAGRAVAVDERDVVEAGQALGELDGVGHRGGGEQEPRRGPVGRGDPSQAAQHVGHVGAEHAAVDVGLVDDHDGEVREEVSPGAVVGQDPDVEHVGVGEHQVRPLPDGAALLAARVAVVDRRPDLLVQAEPVERAGLVLGQRLRRVEVERAGARVRAQDVERRQVEAQRLARRGARGDDRRPGPRRLQRLGLVGVEGVDPGRGEALAHERVKVVGDRLEARLARALEGLAHEALVRPSGVEQVGPRLDASVDGHRSHAR